MNKLFWFTDDIDNLICININAVVSLGVSAVGADYTRVYLTDGRQAHVKASMVSVFNTFNQVDKA